MNWERLFKAQAELDKHIEQEKGLQGQDLLDKKILALQVELGELANEWRGFKFWKVDPQPRTKVEHLCPTCDATGYDRVGNHFDRDVPCMDCNGKGKLGESNPLLEEYVDCLHFILSIGNDLEVYIVELNKHKEDNIISQFIELNYQTYRVMQKNGWLKLQGRSEFSLLVDVFMGLGEMLGFTEQHIEDAYYAKNEINHKRQENAY